VEALGLVEPLGLAEALGLGDAGAPVPAEHAPIRVDSKTITSSDVRVVIMVIGR